VLSSFMNLRRQIGFNIRRARILRDISQIDLAFEAKVSDKSLSNIELGKQNVTIGTLERLAKVLGMPAIDLFAPVAASAVMPKNLPRGKNVHHRGRRVKAKKV
jgi:transcriptional regulator with XRE-family HTH domain